MADIAIDLVEASAGSGSGATRRARRVMVLLAAIVVLSVADLLVTLEHMRAVGMFEANPIAVYIVRTTGSPWALAAYKGVTVGICVTLLGCVRRHRVGEVATWGALAIMVGLSLWWHSYSEALDLPPDVDITRVAELSDAWLQFD